MLGLALSIWSPTMFAAPGNVAATALDFAAAAARILNRNSPGARASVVDHQAGTVTITEYGGASTINGSVASGVVDEEDMPVGWSRGPRQTYIITSPQTDSPPPNQTYAPGNSVLFQFTGQVFELKTGLNSSAGSLAFRWTEDGISWEQLYFPGPADQDNWIQVDFGSPASRIVEVICCDQNFIPNGFNFDTGSAIPAAYIDDDMPRVVMFGDSYVFGQNADDEGAGSTNPNNQKAINGMTRKLGEHLGCLQVANHGLRGTRFTSVQANRSSYADRLTGGASFPGYGEIFVDLDQQGTERDLFIIPSTINDDSANAETEIGQRRRGDTADAFRRLRAALPNTMIMFPIGARAPHFGESDHWLDNYKDGFKDVFGETEAEWIANGAYLLDGSRRDGENWTPAGAEGSSIYFGQPAGDSGHPTAAGHDYIASKYAAGAIYMAQEIVKAAVEEGYGTELWNPATATLGPGWVDNGNGSYTQSGNVNGNLGLIDARIVEGKAYVLRLTVDEGMTGELRVRLSGGQNVSITSAGVYSVVLDDKSTATSLTIQGLISFNGTVRDISLRAV